MSSETFKIAVTISLVEGVTRGLQLMSRHFKTTNAEATALQERLDKIGKMALTGGILVGVGAGILGMLKPAVEEASKYQTLVERLRQLGLGDAAMKDALKFVEAQDIMGASQRDMLRYFVEAQGVFRETGANTVAEQLAAAKTAAPMLAKINFATRGLSENGIDFSEAKQMDMLRFVEQAGGLRSPARFNALLDAGFRSIQSSGGNVDFSQFRQFMARGGSAAMNLSMRSLFADFEPLIGEMKGFTAGTSLMTAFNRMHGIVKLPNQVAHELVKNGIWDQAKIQWNSQGGIKQFLGDPLRNANTFSSDPVEFYRQSIMPMYAGKSQAERTVENARIFGRTGGALFNLIDRQLPTILRSRDAFNKSRGITSEYEAVGKTFKGQEAKLTAKWQTLMLTIGKDGGVLDLATKGLELLGDALSSIIKFAKQHPTLTKLATEGTALLGVLAIIGGTFAIITAGFEGLGLVLGILGVVISPIGLIAVGVSAALALVAYNWKNIWPVIEGIGKWIGKTFSSIFDAITGWISKLLNWVSKSPLGQAVGNAVGGVRSVTKTPLGRAAVGSILNLIPGGSGLMPLFAPTPQKQAYHPSIEPPRPRNAALTVHTQVNLDGRRIASVVSGHMARSMSGPSVGANRFDPARAPLWPDTATA